MLRDLINKIRYRSRLVKFHQFMGLLKPTSASKLLEVGVASKEYSPFDNFLIKNYPFRENITALGIGDLSEFTKNYPDLKTVIYDGKIFPFADKSFDIAHANAVIEHVGPIEAQELFLREIVRVSKRGMVTTPCKYFPIEIHTRVPFLHYFGKRIFDRFLKMIGKEWATGDYMYLLGRKELEMLAKKIGLENYIIIKNRFLGLTATYSLIWYEKV
ncbi:MAG: methyltransferase domain-containing protein [Thermodesulfovibrionales bacterium]